MPSIVPGFEYDIFISYRQKDNKGDHWVTEFVNALKTELEATFKEDISIYFDENPHDGLHEHHDVDDSLKGKLKCLVFIPILSHTYCDPKSFAFEHEFKAFVQQASQDQFGLKVKLASGNTAGRVLPIRIHDLEEEDVKLFEAETHAVLRPIDFIFKSTGVNRPLRAGDDEIKEITHKVFYRDQINKVANAIREIMSGLKQTRAQTGVQHQKEIVKPVKETTPRSWRKPALISALVVLVALAAYYFLRPPTLKPAAESGLAIMPFTNNSGRGDLDFLSVGMASEIRSRISMSKQFEFISAMQATLPYLKDPKTLKEVGNELEVDYILSGIYQADGNRIRVVAEFLDAKTGRLIWSLPVEKELAGIFDMQGEIAAEVIKKFSPGGQVADEVGGTTNLEAYALYKEGEQLTWESYQDSILNKAIVKFRQAIRLDSGYAMAWASLIIKESQLYIQRYNAERLSRITQYIAYVRLHFPSSWISDLADGIYFYRISFDFELALQSFNRVLEKDPDNVEAISLIGSIYKRRLEYEKSLEWRKKHIQLQPKDGMAWGEVGIVFKEMGDYKNALKAFLKQWEFLRTQSFALNVLTIAAETGYPIDQLPEDLLKKTEYWPEVWKSDSRRDWESLLKVARKMNAWNIVAEAFHMLNQPDSARYWADKHLQKYPGEYPDEWHMMLAILGEREKAMKSIDDFYEHIIRTGNDRQQQCYKIISQIDIMILLKDFPEATRLLKKLNEDFPEYQYFEPFFRLGWYSGIRKDYPPFNEALRNLKRRPVPDVSQYIKLD